MPLTQPVDTLVFKAMFEEALLGEGVQALSFLAILCTSYGRMARAEIDRRLGVSGSTPPALEERWLTPAEAAPLLRISKKSLSRRWRSLPFCVPSVNSRGFRVSQRGLNEYMAGGGKK